MPTNRAAARRQPIRQSALTPHEQCIFAAGYLEAIDDHAGDAEQIARQDAEIRRLARALATAQHDLERVKRTAAALDDEASAYFAQMQRAGLFDAELEERKRQYRARHTMTVAMRAPMAEPDYRGGPVAWAS